MSSHSTRSLLFPVTPSAADGVTNGQHSFAEWLAAVDAYLISQIGLDSASMRDWLWCDAYERGSSAEEAADEFLADIFTPL